VEICVQEDCLYTFDHQKTHVMLKKLNKKVLTPNPVKLTDYNK
jgi:hypothetical protein